MRTSALLCSLLLLAGCQNSGALSDWLSVGQSTASAAGYTKEAGAVGAVNDILTSSAGMAGAIMGRPGSYNIPLPEQIQSLNTTLSKFGYNGLSTLQQKMNAAASAAAAEVTPAFKDAARNMTVVDAVGLIAGGDTAVTDFFRNRTRTQLTAKMGPVVQQKLAATGFNTEYQTFLSVYNTLPLANKPNLDIQSYVVDKTLDGLYSKMGDEEKAIRKDPRKAGSALVKQFLSTDTK